MAFTEFPIPTQKLSEATTVSSLEIGEFLIAVTPSGIRRVTKGNVGFARFFVQSTEPTAQTTQDIWIDTVSGNSIKVWDGANWVARNFSTSAGNIPITALADIDSQRILGRITADSGEVETLTAAQLRTIIDVAEGANNYSHPNHTGDVTSDGDGEQTIANDAVTNAKAAQMPARSIKANGTDSQANAQDIEISANQFLARGSSGDLEGKFISDFILTLAGLSNSGAAKSHLEVPDLAFVPVLSANGDTSTPSVIHFQLRDSDLNAISREAFLRVRLCEQDGYDVKGGPDAMAATGGTTLVETISTGNDLVVRSNATGLFEIELDHSDTSTSTIRIGVAPVGSENANYTQTLDVTPSDAS